MPSPAASPPQPLQQVLLPAHRLALVLGPFLLISGVHLWAKLVEGETGVWVDTVTKPLLMPTLLLGFLAAAPRLRGRVVLLAAAGIVLSWLGDVLLGDFVLGLSCFLLAHLVYIAMFFAAFGGDRRWPPPWTLLYAAAFAVLAIVLAPHLGELLVPVILYGAVLCAMAAAAALGNALTALGGALFLVSDSLLALDRFHPAEPVPWNPHFLIMLSYLAAQGLIALGVLRRLRRTALG